MRLRISVALVALLAAVTVLLVGTGSAGAVTKDSTPVNTTANPTDPQNTNVPYVAWAGEHIKVTKCLDIKGGLEAQSLSGFDLTGTLTVEDWSGVDEVNAGPKWLNTTGPLGVTGVWERGHGLCFSGIVTSQKPGLAVIKLALNDGLLEQFFTGHNDTELVHDFLAIWLQSQAPAITEIKTPGDPAGDGVFNVIPSAQGNYFGAGLVQVLVKGTFPMLNDFASWDFTGTTLHNGTITLPDDWSYLANHLAVDGSALGSAYPGAAAQRWDIHDDDLTTEGHVVTSFCLDKTDPSLAVDAVDNCLGGWKGDAADFGPFSNIFGGTNHWAVGPFDPIRADSTLLSDGKLDSSDAPMPALRVDVSLGAGSQVGSLSSVDKTSIYIRNSLLDPGSPHNLYAPFYKAYVPAAWAGSNTSGVFGTFNNNSEGFLTFPWNQLDGIDPAVSSQEESMGKPIYDFWDTFTLNYTEGYNDCYEVNGSAFPTPTGDQSVAVYTDEHGEAYVQFNPDVGNVLNPDSNGRCDVYHGSLSQSATISARSVYPDQQVFWDQGNKVSNVLTKTVNFIPNKTLVCVPKGVNEAFCVETVVDLDGNPVAGAKVEFTAQAGQGSAPKIQVDGTKLGGYDTTGQYLVGQTPDYVDVNTNDLGEAGISVVSSTNACINVEAENLGTRNYGAGIFRFAEWNPTGPTGGTSCSLGGGGTTTSTTTTTTTTAATGGTAGGTSPQVVAAPVALTTPAPTAAAPAKAATAAKATLVSAAVLKTRAGRVLTVRVNSTARTAKLRITLIGKNGKVSRIVLRTVATNHVVRIANLKLAPSVKSVQVALA